MKTCTGCLLEQPLSNYGTRVYHKGTPEEYLYVYAKCKTCRKVVKKQYEINNRDKHLASRRSHYKNTRQSKLDQRKKWRENNKEKHRLGSKIWAQNNPERVKENHKRWLEQNKEYLSNYHRHKIATDLSYKLLRTLRSRFSQAIKAAKLEKTKSVFDFVDYTTEDLKNHLESLFKEGMSWNTFGKKGWVIDHIKPCAMFQLDDEEDLKKLWALSNLQPLWFSENCKKNSLYEGVKYYHKKQTT